jgi:hypothetical protein
MFTIDLDRCQDQQIDSLTVQLFEKAFETYGKDAPHLLMNDGAPTKLIAHCRATAEALLLAPSAEPVKPVGNSALAEFVSIVRAMRKASDNTNKSVTVTIECRSDAEGDYWKASCSDVLSTGTSAEALGAIKFLRDGAAKQSLATLERLRAAADGMAASLPTEAP